MGSIYPNFVLDHSVSVITLFFKKACLQTTFSKGFSEKSSNNVVGLINRRNGCVQEG